MYSLAKIYFYYVGFSNRGLFCAYTLNLYVVIYKCMRLQNMNLGITLLGSFECH